MSSRILFWNVNNFTLSRISGTSALNQQQVAACNQYMLRQAFGTNVPDIFVVIEVFGRTRDVNVEGTVLTSDSDAGMACVMFLNNIRAYYGSAWALVPPINLGALGFREGVAVFYNSAKLQFIGPNIYCNTSLSTSPLGQSLPITQPNYANIMDYEDRWKNGLPTGATRQITVTVGGNSVNIPENRLAGQWIYYTAGPNPEQILFPLAGSRPPFFTQFRELTGGRVLNLYSIHTSPSFAKQAMDNIAKIPDLAAAPANSTNIILGDFNVDTYSDKASCYNWYLVTAGYDLLLTPMASDGTIYPSRKPYLMTHLLPIDQATPCAPTVGQTPAPNLNVYPRYGYMGSYFNGLNNSGAIDNCMVLYGTGTTKPADYNRTIMNPVVGKPYTVPNPPIQGVDAECTSGLAFASTLANPIPAGGAPATSTATFQAWQNFAGIRTVSDHLAVLVDV